MKYLIKLKFVGTMFNGFQVQPGKRTVQSTLQDAIEKAFGSRFDVKGCSRTDSGVHANAFYASFNTDATASNIPLEKIPNALNSVLPDDIAVLNAWAVSDDFHVRHSVAFKEYVYIIRDGCVRDPFDVNRVFFCPLFISDEMINRMNEAGKAISGKHNFRCFMASGSKITDTVRTVRYVNVLREGEYVKIYIAADGFLYNMVRIIAGTLMDAARGKIDPNTVKKIIESGDRRLAGATLPAAGLYLNHVEYNFNTDKDR